MVIPTSFFGPLSRRSSYTRKVDGSNYSYTYYRQNFQKEIAEDCNECCVYCDSHETEVGGREAMQLDHFRPYTRSGFEHLEDEPSNLHHSCSRCNLLKSDHWPCKDTKLCHSGKTGFIDPFAEVRSEFFEVAEDGTLVARQDPAQYLVQLLALDRPHLRRLRQIRILKGKLRVLVKEILPRLEDIHQKKSTLSEEEVTKCLELVRLCNLVLELE